MNIKEVMLRICARYAGIEFTTIGKKTYSSMEKTVLIEKVLEFKERFKDQFFIHYNPNGISTKSIETHIHKLSKSGIKVDDLFVDYLQLLESSGNPRAPRVEKMTELPKEVRKLAQKLNTRIFIPAQLKSEARKKPIEDITGDDVHFCKDLEKECHILAVLHDEDGHKKFKYLVARFKYDQETYFFPDANLDYMYFGKSRIWDDSYARKDEENTVADWEKDLEEAKNNDKPWD